MCILKVAGPFAPCFFFDAFFKVIPKMYASVLLLPESWLHFPQTRTLRALCPLWQGSLDDMNSSRALQQAQGFSLPICQVGIDGIQGVTAECRLWGSLLPFLRDLVVLCATNAPMPSTWYVDVGSKTGSLPSM